MIQVCFGFEPLRNLNHHPLAPPETIRAQLPFRSGGCTRTWLLPQPSAHAKTNIFSTRFRKRKPRALSDLQHGKRHQSNMLLASLPESTMQRTLLFVHEGTNSLRVLRHEGRSQNAASMVRCFQPKHSHALCRNIDEHCFNEFHTTEVPCRLLLLVYPCTEPATVVAELACCWSGLSSAAS